MEHGLAILVFDGGLSSGESVAQVGILCLAHEQVGILIEVSHGRFQDGLHHFGLEATVVELEIVPDDPAVIQL